VDFDILVIGAGPAGQSAAIALARRGHSVGIIERSPLESIAEPAFDGREIALTHRSVRVLQDLGIWSNIPAGAVSALKAAIVMNGGSRYQLKFDPGRSRRESLGHLVPNHEIRRAAYRAAAAAPRVSLLTGRGVAAIDSTADATVVRTSTGERFTGRLVIAADSRFSDARRAAGIAAEMVDFGKTMLVCRMRHEHSHESTAWEWFQDGCTLALLPLNDRESSVVITESAQGARRLQVLGEFEFDAEMERRFERRMGRMTLTSTRHVYPLVATYARRFVGPRLAMIGDAAVGMHPVTAHGFNLALRSQESLVREIEHARACGQDIGADGVLRRYESRHRRDSLPLYLATNAIVRLYTDRRPLANACRSLGLRIANRLAPLNRSIVGLLTESGAS